MGVKRVVNSGFWTDGKVDEFSPEDKYFLLYLLTNPFSKQLGIYEMSVKQAAFQLGYSEDTVRVLLDRFENKYHMILYSWTTNEVAILNFLRHSVIKGGKPVEDCIWKDINAVKDKKLVKAVFTHLKGKDGLNATVKKIIHTYMLDNDNNSCVDMPSPVPSNPLPSGPAPADKKPKKYKCGEYKHVLLTQAQLEKLTEDYGANRTGEAIKFLDEYIEMKGYKANNHNLALRKWVFDAIDERDRRRGNNAGSANQSGANPFYEMYMEETGGDVIYDES